MRLPRSGLRFYPVDRRAALKSVALSIAGVTLFIAALDLAFRDHLAPGYVAMFTAPLLPRMLVMAVLAGWEELVYRLGVMTVLAVVLSRGTGRLSPAMWLVCAVMAQLANVGALVLADPLYASLRYLAVGTVWGWLYWRHGWLSAIAGHVGCHLVLDPLLFYVLA